MDFLFQLGIPQKSLKKFLGHKIITLNKSVLPNSMNIQYIIFYIIIDSVVKADWKKFRILLAQAIIKQIIINLAKHSILVKPNALILIKLLQILVLDCTSLNLTSEFMMELTKVNNRFYMYEKYYLTIYTLINISVNLMNYNISTINGNEP
mgnify:CR=1 FL=1